VAPEAFIVVELRLQIVYEEEVITSVGVATGVIVTVAELPDAQPDVLPDTVYTVAVIGDTVTEAAVNPPGFQV